jgi:hypothetical protein
MARSPAHLTRPILQLIAFIALLTSCSNDATAPSEPEQPSFLSLARAYRMTGEGVTTTADGRTGECVLDLVFELRERSGKNKDYVEYAGVHGGDVARAITASDGSGFAFSAFVFGEMTMRRYRNGAIEIHIPINETTDVPFYREMALIRGTVGRGRNAAASGAWRCGPLQIDQGGYVDLDIFVDGTWRLEPQR